MVSQKTGGCSKQLQKVAAIGEMSSSLIPIRCRRQEMVVALQKVAAVGGKSSSTNSDSLPTAGSFRRQYPDSDLTRLHVFLSFFCLFLKNTQQICEFNIFYQENSWRFH